MPDVEETEPGFAGLLRALLLGPRAWKRRWVALVRTIEHREILASTEEDAAFSFNYAFMVAIASGIATIGLLLNSPAVIIGAMLISPLMAPIVGTGFAIAVFDVELGKRSARTLLLGALAAVLFAAAIVLLSPVKELTSEILARTRPNLFDLAVAILSGAAGGYGMIRGRGGAIVGVAIATALMPPLAVTGYGLATWQWPVTRGALLLFVTNMVAISLSVAAMATWYGFGRGGLRKRFARQALFSLLLLAPLSVPLFISLRSIAWESRVQTTVRTVLDAGAGRLAAGQVAQVRVHFSRGEPPFVEAIVVSQRPQFGLSAQMRDELKQALGVPVNLRLTQLRADDPESAAMTLAQTGLKPSPAQIGADLAVAVRKEIPFAITAIETGAGHRSVVVVPRFQDGMDLSAWHTLETELNRRHPDWRVSLVPPAAGFAPLRFAVGAHTLDAAALERLRLIAWALNRWGVKEVRLIGHASSAADGTLALAQRRVASVADWFGGNGIVVHGQAFYPVPRQAALEKEFGEASLRSVEIVLAAPQAAPPLEGKSERRQP